MKGKFLIVTYAGKPKDPSQTAKKGYIKENMVYDEKVGLSNKLRDKDILTASLILDLQYKKIIRRKKSHVNSDNYEFLYEYFYKNYKQHMDKFLNEKTVG